MEIENAATKRVRVIGGSDGCSSINLDRLSALPDSLLHTIMSFLKARQAVQTCVLATRWRLLWRTVPCPCIDIEYDEFICRTAAAAPYKDRAEEWEDFEDFTSILMHRCNVALLDSLSLRVCPKRAPSFAHEQAGVWLRRAMKFCTLDVPLQRTDGGLRSSCWRVKRLYLCNVSLDTHFGKPVHSACQSLEDLELKDCSCGFEAITSGSLKSLVLKNCWWNNLSEITSPTLSA